MCRVCWVAVVAKITATYSWNHNVQYVKVSIFWWLFVNVLDHGHVSRHLLQSDENCTPAAIEQFPKTPLSQEQRQEGAIVIHILITVYMFMGLALVCDDYFVPACEKMCDSEYINLYSQSSSWSSMVLFITLFCTSINLRRKKCV